jgi:hypothetical protein
LDNENERFPKKLFVKFLETKVVDKQKFKELYLDRVNYFNDKEQLIDLMIYNDYNPDFMDRNMRIMRSRAFAECNLLLRSVFGDNFLSDDTIESFKHIWESALFLEWMSELEELILKTYKGE